MHYNENSPREQARDKHGEPRYAVQYPKAKKGEPAVRKLKTKPTFGKYNIWFFIIVIINFYFNKSHYQAY